MYNNKEHANSETTSYSISTVLIVAISINLHIKSSLKLNIVAIYLSIKHKKLIADMRVLIIINLSPPSYISVKYFFKY